MTDLTAIATDSSSATVTWTPGTKSHQDSYQLRYHGTHQATAWSSVVSSTSEKTLTGLFPGDTYTFEVKAVSGSEISAGETTTTVMCKLQQHFHVTSLTILSVH